MNTCMCTYLKTHYIYPMSDIIGIANETKKNNTKAVNALSIGVVASSVVFSVSLHW